MVTDVSGEQISHIFKRKEVEEEFEYGAVSVSLNVGKQLPF
jgi:hypothetical protein